MTNEQRRMKTWIETRKKYFLHCTNTIRKLKETNSAKNIVKVTLFSIAVRFRQKINYFA